MRILLLCLSLFLISGCVSSDRGKNKALPAVSEQSDLAAKQLGTALLQNFASGNTYGFLRLLPSEVHKQFNVNEFNKAQSMIFKQHGKIESFEYVTRLDTPVYKAYLWKVRFAQAGVQNKNNTVRHDTLFRIVVSFNGVKPYLISFGFL